ncbi:MAG: helix-turn-helix domain-containing protein [Campylobacteraceae bacterium]|jgi:hypothetical protein|nr:helix-turn-helix domain-containing protein [Campylobacteraceae bacterium]
MRKLTVADAALELGITKEAIYNRIRRGSLQSVQENSERYILLEDTVNEPVKQPHIPKKTVVPDERYINLLISQIAELKATNSELNKDKERLIKEKEQLLIEQRVALETIYKERDEQLKAILMLANRSLLAKPVDDVEKVTIDASFEERMEKWREKTATTEENETDKADKDFSDWRELKSYLKAKGFSKKRKKEIVSQAQKSIGIADDIAEDEGVLYIKKDAELIKTMR